MELICQYHPKSKYKIW